MQLTREEAVTHLNRRGAQLVHVPDDGPPRRVTAKTGLPPGGQVHLLHDERGALTTAGMRAALAEGGSVMVDGNSLATAAELPTEDDLAAGDAERQARLAADLDEEMARLQARRARLSAGQQQTHGQRAVQPATVGQQPVPTPQAQPAHHAAPQATPHAHRDDDEKHRATKGK
jgi:hypothetical protein